MQTTDLAVILAAGNGSRLRSVSGTLPKPLVRLGRTPLLEHIILGLQVSGIRKFVIVTGYGGEEIRSWVKARRFLGAQIEFVQNQDYKKSNGVSVLKTRAFVDKPFLLVMGDHVFEPETATELLSQAVESDETILAVDYKLGSIFDMDDATKVACRGDRIIHIGKDIYPYHGVDTGMFLCTPSLFSALDRSTVDGNCSLSDGMRLLAVRRKLRAFDIGGAVWQDCDTPEALQFARRLFVERYRTVEFEAEAARV